MRLFLEHSMRGRENPLARGRLKNAQGTRLTLRTDEATDVQSAPRRKLHEPSRRETCACISYAEWITRWLQTPGFVGFQSRPRKFLDSLEGSGRWMSPEARAPALPHSLLLPNPVAAQRRRAYGPRRHASIALRAPPDRRRVHAGEGRVRCAAVHPDPPPGHHLQPRPDAPGDRRSGG